MIGTGPFELQEWRVNERLVVTRNPNYWRDGYPLLDKITFRPVPDSDVRLTQFEGGQLDVMHTSEHRRHRRAPRSERRPARPPSYESDQGAEVAYLMLNSSKPPFDDILARKAVAVRARTPRRSTRSATAASPSWRTGRSARDDGLL